MKKTFLITGITGFAGAHLANLLIEAGHKVYGLVRGSNGMETDILDVVPPENYEKITFIYGDLTDQRAIEDIFISIEDIDGCFHLAAQSHPPTSLKFPLDTFRANIMGTAHLIEAIQTFRPECKLMFCSTSEVYGNAGKDGGLLKETDPLTPSNPYAVSKAAIDLYMQERMTNGRIKGFITRAFSHTGTRRGKNFSISSDAYQIARIMKGLQEPIVRVGNLETTRVVISVQDTVRAYYLLMMNEKSDGKIFNVCGDIPRKMEYFTDALIRTARMASEFTVEWKDEVVLGIFKEVSPEFYREIDIAYQHGDTAALRELTGWQPKFSIDITLDELLHYWLKKIS